MKKVIVIMMCLLLANISFAEEFTPTGKLITDKQVETDLKKSLSDRYPDNFSIQLTLFRSNMAAYQQSKTIDKSGSLGKFFAKRVRMYYPKYSIIMTLYRSNLESRNALK